MLDYQRRVQAIEDRRRRKQLVRDRALAREKRAEEDAVCCHHLTKLDLDGGISALISLSLSLSLFLSRSQLKAVERERRRMDQEYYRKLNQLDTEIDRINRNRRTPLGQDRDHNRYWLFHQDPSTLYLEAPDRQTWSYYSTVEEVEALYEWLNEKGVREKRLRAALTETFLMMKTAMRKRQNELKRQQDENSRSTRNQQRDMDEHLCYENKLQRI